MNNNWRWLLWIAALVLVGNFVVLMLYGDTLRSTNLFIVRGTVFYPLAYLNLAIGLILVLRLILDLFKKKV
jgi:hypothetical protein